MLVENKTDRFGTRLWINSYSFSAGVANGEKSFLPFSGTSHAANESYSLPRAMRGGCFRRVDTVGGTFEWFIVRDTRLVPLIKIASSFLRSRGAASGVRIRERAKEGGRKGQGEDGWSKVNVPASSSKGKAEFVADEICSVIKSRLRNAYRRFFLFFFYFTFAPFLFSSPFFSSFFHFVFLLVFLLFSTETPLVLMGTTSSVVEQFSVIRLLLFFFFVISGNKIRYRLD